MIDWNEIRKDFPVCQNLAYFQNAGMSPVPIPVYNAITNAWKKILEYGDLDWKGDMESIEKMKAHLASIIHTSAENLAFIQNSSLALNMVAMALKRKFGEGFNVVTMEHEFPSTNVPFASQGIEVKYVKAKDARFNIEDIEKHIDNHTKAIVTSWVQYATGFKQDIEALGIIAKKHHLLFIVNATQALPIFEMDVEKMNIDVMTASLHKWGCCGHVGAAFYTSPQYRKEFPCPIAGWLSVMPPEDDFIPTQKDKPFVAYPSAAQYNWGTTNSQNLLGLKASLEYMANIGFDNIRARIFEITTYLIQKLNELPLTIISPIDNLEERSGIISISLDHASNTQCFQYLENKNVATSLRMGNIRIAPSYFNTHQDVDILVHHLKDFLKK